MSNPTAAARSICQALIEGHFPLEIAHFGTIWDAFWKSLPEDSLESLNSLPAWRFDDPKAFAATTATNTQAIDSLHVIAAIVSTALTLLRENENRVLIDTARIGDTLLAEAHRLQAPDHVRRVLESHGIRLFAEHFSAVDWEGESKTPGKRTSGALLVEWCDPGDTDMIHTGVRDNFAVEREFRSRADDFVLYVDESKRVILVHDAEIPWRTFQARHFRFLHLVLEALSHTRVVRYQQVAEKVLGVQYAPGDKIRRLKSEVNGKVLGALDSFLTVQKGMEYYNVDPQPFCWIRYEGALSLLTS